MENKILFKRDISGNVIYWFANTVPGMISFYYGVLTEKFNSDNLGIPNYNKKIEEISKTKVILEREYKSQLKKGYKHYVAIDYNFVKYNWTSINNIVDKTNTSVDYYIQSMKCQPFKRGRLGKYNIIQPKINGVRCNVFEDNFSVNLFDTNSVTLLSREHINYHAEHLYSRLLEIIKFIKNRFDIPAPILDGELYIPFVKVATIAGAAKNIKNPYNKSLQYIIYDIAVDNLTMMERYDIIEAIRTELGITVHSNSYLTPLVYTSENIFVNNDDDCYNYMEVKIEQGYEGAVVRDLEATYHFGQRPKVMQKLKKFYDGEFVVIDMVEYGDLAQKIGYGVKLICTNDSNDCTFEATIGGKFGKFENDFSAHNKRLIFENRSKFIGKLATLKYYERTKNEIPLHANAVHIEGLEEIL